jgi:hypothetical protein
MNWEKKLKNHHYHHELREKTKKSSWHWSHVSWTDNRKAKTHKSIKNNRTSKRELTITQHENMNILNHAVHRPNQTWFN